MKGISNLVHNARSRARVKTTLSLGSSFACLGRNQLSEDDKYIPNQAYLELATVYYPGLTLCGTGNPDFCKNPSAISPEELY